MESNTALRFIQADRVDTPAGRLKDFTAVSPTDAKLGNLDGVVVDPAARRVRYYVLKTAGRLVSHHYLVPAAPARIEAERRTVQFDVEPNGLSTLEETDPRSFSNFSAEDVIEAIFSKRLAG